MHITMSHCFFTGEKEKCHLSFEYKTDEKKETFEPKLFELKYDFFWHIRILSEMMKGTKMNIVDEH